MLFSLLSVRVCSLRALLQRASFLHVPSETCTVFGRWCCTRSAAWLWRATLASFRREPLDSCCRDTAFSVPMRGGRQPPAPRTVPVCREHRGARRTKSLIFLNTHLAGTRLSYAHRKTYMDELSQSLFCEPSGELYLGGVDPVSHVLYVQKSSELLAISRSRVEQSRLKFHISGVAPKLLPSSLFIFKPCPRVRFSGFGAEYLSRLARFCHFPSWPELREIDFSHSGVPFLVRGSTA